MVLSTNGVFEMEKIVLNLVKLFIIHAKENNILELDINDLRDNFQRFKEMEAYQSLLYSYVFEQNNMCGKLEKEINDLIKSKQLFLFDNLLYIFNINTSVKNKFPLDINRIINQMVQDYIKLNMEKAKQKIKMD